MLEDIVSIHDAATPNQLWRWLVLHPNAMAATLTWHATSAFTRVHQGNRDGAVRTASLLCTDRRWRRITGRLIAELVDANVLDDRELDDLADHFLMLDTFPWRIPSIWLKDKTVRVTGGHRSKKPVCIERPIATPLRRWAAKRLAVRHPSTVGAILARMETLPSRDRDAVMVGLLDATSQFPKDARELLVSVGIDWPGGPVRRRALQLLADDGRHHEAASLAARDPSVKARVWGEKLVRNRTAPRQMALAARAQEVDDPRTESALVQSSLFAD